MRSGTRAKEAQDARSDRRDPGLSAVTKTIQRELELEKNQH